MRNRFEARVSAIVPRRFGYETTTVPYTISHTYLPDWFDASTNTVIETKGRFTAVDRRKMAAIRKERPSLRIIMVSKRPNTPISERSRTTYRQWAERNGIESMTPDQLALL